VLLDLVGVEFLDGRKTQRLAELLGQRVDQPIHGRVGVGGEQLLLGIGAMRGRLRMEPGSPSSRRGWLRRWSIACRRTARGRNACSSFICRDATGLPPRVQALRRTGKREGSDLFCGRSMLGFAEGAPLEADVAEISELKAPGEAVGGDQVMMAEGGFARAIPGKQRAKTEKKEGHEATST